MPAARRICIRGHDTEVVGRYANYTCRECARISHKSRRSREDVHRFCPQGHDKDSLGRDPRGWCLICSRARNHRSSQNFRARNFGLPASRLRRICTRAQAEAAWLGFRECTLNAAKRAMDRLWTADRIPLEVADRWCIALGTHLAIVYPEAYPERFTAEEVA